MMAQKLVIFLRENPEILASKEKKKKINNNNNLSVSGM